MPGGVAPPPDGAWRQGGRGDSARAVLAQSRGQVSYDADPSFERCVCFLFPSCRQCAVLFTLTVGFWLLTVGWLLLAIVGLVTILLFTAAICWLLSLTVGW